MRLLQPFSDLHLKSKEERNGLRLASLSSPAWGSALADDSHIQLDNTAQVNFQMDYTNSSVCLYTTTVRVRVRLLSPVQTQLAGCSQDVDHALSPQLLAQDGSGDEAASSADSSTAGAKMWVFVG